MFPPHEKREMILSPSVSGKRCINQYQKISSCNPQLAINLPVRGEKINKYFCKRGTEWEICVDKGTWSCFVFTVSVALSGSTAPHRCMHAVGPCDLQESGATLGFSLDLYIVVRCIAHSIKLLRRGVRICAMFQPIQRRSVEV